MQREEAVTVAGSNNHQVLPRQAWIQVPKGIGGGAIWIAVMGVLLAGVVALNVAVLRLNIQSDQLTEERAQLRAESAELSSQLALRAASARTSSLARNQLGLQPAGTTRYLDLRQR